MYKKNGFKNFSESFVVTEQSISNNTTLTLTYTTLTLTYKNDSDTSVNLELKKSDGITPYITIELSQGKKTIEIIDIPEGDLYWTITKVESTGVESIDLTSILPEISFIIRNINNEIIYNYLESNVNNHDHFSTNEPISQFNKILTLTYKNLNETNVNINIENSDGNVVLNTITYTLFKGNDKNIINIELPFSNNNSYRLTIDDPNNITLKLEDQTNNLIYIDSNYYNSNYYFFTLGYGINNTTSSTYQQQYGYTTPGYNETNYEDTITYENNLLSGIGLRNVTQSKYYETGSINSGTYKLYPKYYMKYKSEMRFLDIIKSSLDLPEEYQEVNAIKILENILGYTKLLILGEKTAMINSLITSIINYITEIKNIIKPTNDDDKKIYDECYKNVKKLLNTFDIGRILCLIKKNNGYITNEIKKDIINFIFKFKSTLLDSFDDLILYSFAKIIHLSTIFGENMNFVESMNKYLYKSANNTTSATAGISYNDNKIIAEFINLQKIPKKLFVYIVVLLESLTYLTLGKVESFNTLLLLVKNAIDIGMYVHLQRLNDTTEMPIVLGELSLFILDTILYNLYYSSEDQNKSDNVNITTTSSYWYSTYQDKSLFDSLFGDLVKDISILNLDALIDKINEDNNLDPFYVNENQIENIMGLVKLLTTFTSV